MFFGITIRRDHFPRFHLLGTGVVVVDLADVDVTALILRIVLLFLPIVVVALLTHQYMVSEFDGADALIRLLDAVVNGGVLDPSDPWRLGHGRIDLFQGKLALYRLLIDIRYHVGRLDKRHRK